MRIAIVGTGYVGLVSGACLSEFGHHVVCIDKDAEKIAALQQGRIPIFEPGLEDLVTRNQAAGRISFATDLAASIPGCEAIFIAVGTPSRRGDGDADLSFVEASVREIAPVIDRNSVIITKSTVPVGTGRWITEMLDRLRPDGGLHVASNPEFLREGAAISDFMRPDRIIVGVESERARDVIRSIYRPLYLNETPMLFVSLETAELTKYAANAFLAAKVSFINEIADIAEQVGANVQDIARGIGLDGRIGRKFLHAGPGFGGSCFPKDTRALASLARKVERPSLIVESVITANDRRKQLLIERVKGAVGGSLAGKTIAILGVTFKPNTDDMRESPSLSLLPALKEAGANLRVYDPEGMTEARKHIDGATWCRDSYEAIQQADAMVILTEWNQFRALDLQQVKQKMRVPLIVDLRNIYKPEEMAAAGFAYISVGRAPIDRPSNPHV